MSQRGMRDRTRLARFAAGQAGRAMVSRLLRSRLLRWRFGPLADRLILVPQDLRTGDPSFASELAYGQMGLAGVSASLAERSPFEVPPPSEAWERTLHGFGWLRHMKAARSDRHRDAARKLVARWVELEQQSRLSGLAFESEVVARRIISWLSHAPLLLEGVDQAHYAAVLESLGRQVQRLATSRTSSRQGYPRLLAATALLLAALTISEQERHLEEHTRNFLAELEDQLLDDGGHVSRNPAVLVDILLDLLPLRQCFLARGWRRPRRCWRPSPA